MSYSYRSNDASSTIYVHTTTSSSNLIFVQFVNSSTTMGNDKLAFCIAILSIFRYIFDDSKIYDLVNNAIWEYDENDQTWYNVGTADTILKDGHVYFNKMLNKLYYYDNQVMSCLNGES